MTASGWGWLAAAGVLAAVDWVAVGEGARPLERIAKPLVLLALIGAAGTRPASDVRGWVIVALCLGVLGDIALAFERQPALVVAGSGPPPRTPRLALTDAGRSDGRLFMAGLGAFLLGHLAYVAAILAYGIDRLSVGFGLLLVLIALLSFGYRIIAGAHTFGGLAMTGGVTLYIVALGSAVVLGVGTAHLGIATGVVLFAVSDLMLGYDRFVQARQWAPLAVIVTYHLAQALLVLGLLH